MVFLAGTGAAEHRCGDVNKLDRNNRSWIIGFDCLDQDRASFASRSQNLNYNGRHDVEAAIGAKLFDQWLKAVNVSHLFHP